jgi:hypothetical protein
MRLPAGTHRVHLGCVDGIAGALRVFARAGKEVTFSWRRRRSQRRNFLKTVGVGALGVAGESFLIHREAVTQPTNQDREFLNFALNLEYLEAEFYLAAIGTNLVAQGAGITGAGDVGTVRLKSGSGGFTCGSGGSAITRVPFTNALVQELALELANDEFNHVVYLRAALAAIGGSCIARPSLDLYESFIAAGNAIGLSSFDPFANDLSFLLGAYLLENITASTYLGAVNSLHDKTILGAVAGILSVEGGHASAVRSTLYTLDYMNRLSSPQFTGIQISGITTAISKMRSTADGTLGFGQDDQGVVKTNPFSTLLAPLTATAQPANIFAADSNSIAFARTVTQVLNIVYQTASYSKAPAHGGFFPDGLNGSFS